MSEESGAVGEEPLIQGISSFAELERRTQIWERDKGE